MLVKIIESIHLERKNLIRTKLIIFYGMAVRQKTLEKLKLIHN